MVEVVQGRESKEAAAVEMERQRGRQESAWAEMFQRGEQIKQEAGQPHSKASTRALWSSCSGPASSPVPYWLCDLGQSTSPP